MKKIILFFLCACCCIQMHAQKQAPTTEDEFLYGASGYKLQLNMKLPMKPGYTLKDYNTIEEPDRKTEFKGLLRNGETKPCAFIMIYTKIRSAPNYYCIPTTDADPELWKKFYKSLIDENNIEQPQLQFLAYCLGHLAQEISSQ